MELKETNNLPNSLEINVAKLSKRNDSNNREAYDILFPRKKDSGDQNIENDYPEKDFEKPKSGAVSTLDWLKTWRSLEIS